MNAVISILIIWLGGTFFFWFTDKHMLDAKTSAKMWIFYLLWPLFLIAFIACCIAVSFGDFAAWVARK